MDTAIIVALISIIPATIASIASVYSAIRGNRNGKDINAVKEEQRKQGEVLTKQERAFEERKRHEELQNEMAMDNLEATQVILESLHREGRVNGDCELHRNKLNSLKTKMASQALHLHDDDIKY